jgi:hypothetical protein
LITNSILEIVKYNPKIYRNKYIFKLRFIRKIKSKTIDFPFEKSRLVIQVFKNKKKRYFLLISNYIASKPKDPFISFAIYPKRSRRFPAITTRYYLSLYLFKDQVIQADFCRDTRRKILSISTRDYYDYS